MGLAGSGRTWCFVCSEIHLGEQTLTMSCVLSIDKVNYNTLKVNLDIELVASTRNKTFETCSNALATFPTCNLLQLSVTLTLLLQSQLSLF